ncbi:MAG TPA: glycosyltransferase [Candidatus Dormibacteraeota bacterium]|nr:glycosyltransferase [Candidatus Dormibacteraeota bacterium]
MPWGLTDVDIPTACFHVDTYAYTRRRIAWSTLFDHVFVFHPAYDTEFGKAGHSGAHFLPHAVDGELFKGREWERNYEVGWVGQVRGPIYRRREMILPALSESFHMNDLARRYSLEEMAKVYRRSRVVVNIGRDDFPQDANLRTFEAMGAGALLITSLPSELTQIGFKEGVHFIGYHEADEIQPLVRKYLADDSARKHIADAARERVLREHTYDQRVESLLRHVETCGKKRLAPARTWAEECVRLAYLDYFAANGAFKYAAKELKRIARLSLKETVLGGSLLSRAYARKVRNWLVARGRSGDAGRARTR